MASVYIDLTMQMSSTIFDVYGKRSLIHARDSMMSFYNALGVEIIRVRSIVSSSLPGTWL